jgi:hypothetical protein
MRDKASLWNYDLINFLYGSLGAIFHLGLAKPFHCWSCFGGAISTLARQGGGSIQDLHWSFILGLFSVLGCSDMLGEFVALGVGSHMLRVFFF